MPTAETNLDTILRTVLAQAEIQKQNLLALAPSFCVKATTPEELDDRLGFPHA